MALELCLRVCYVAELAGQWLSNVKQGNSLTGLTAVSSVSSKMTNDESNFFGDPPKLSILTCATDGSVTVANTGEGVKSARLQDRDRRRKGSNCCLEVLHTDVAGESGSKKV